MKSAYLQIQVYGCLICVYGDVSTFNEVTMEGTRYMGLNNLTYTEWGHVSQENTTTSASPSFARWLCRLFVLEKAFYCLGGLGKFS